MTIPRRSFLKTLLLLLPAGLSRTAVAAPQRHYRLNRFSVAGFQYYAGPRLVGRMAAGTALELVAEPDNPHDHYAVRIDWRGHKLGYVPRSDNHHLSRLLRQGATLNARVLKVDPQAAPWQMLKVEVELEVG